MDRSSQFGASNTDRQNEYADFAQRVEQDPLAISDEEAARRYRELVGQFSDEEVDTVHEQVFGQLPEADRRQLAQQFEAATRDPQRPYQGYPQDFDTQRATQPRELGRMASRAAQEDPNLLDQIVGPDSPLRGTAGKLALAGAAAFLAHRYANRTTVPQADGTSAQPSNLLAQLGKLLNFPGSNQPGVPVSNQEPGGAAPATYASPGLASGQPSSQRGQDMPAGLRSDEEDGGHGRGKDRDFIPPGLRRGDEHPGRGRGQGRGQEKRGKGPKRG